MSKTFTIGTICASLLFFLLITMLSIGVFDGRHVEMGALTGQKRDVITFWVGTLFGSPDEKAYVDVVDEYNRKHPDVFVKEVLIPYNTFPGKTNTAMAVAQPPDVCYNAWLYLDGLRSKQPIPDLAVPVPDDMITPEERRIWGDACLSALSRNGVLFAFPRSKLLAGGTFKGNLEWFEKAGIDIDYYLEHGWDYDTFRDAMKRVQATMRKEKGENASAFGLNLLGADWQLYGRILPNAVGKDMMQRNFLVWDEKRGRYILDPDFTPDLLAQPLRLMQQLINEDGTWNKRTLGMTYTQLEEECFIKGTVAVIHCVTPGDIIQKYSMYMAEYREGRRSHPCQVTNIPVPTPRQGMPLVFGAGSEGFGVLRQIPYKGDAHTRHALEFAKYIVSPRVNARMFEARPERWHPWADEDAVHAELRIADPVTEDPHFRKIWTQYLGWMKSPNIYSSDAVRPNPQDFTVLVGRISTYETFGNGHQIVESVLYNKKDPKKAAEQLIKGISGVIEEYYHENPPGKSR